MERPTAKMPAPDVNNLGLIAAISAMDCEASLARMQSAASGLSPAQAAERLRQYGENLVTGKRAFPLLGELARHLASPLPLLLLALSVVNYLTGQRWSAAVIAIMVILSSLLSFVQEHRSNRAARELRKIVDIQVSVLRQCDAPVCVAAEHIVPGDIVSLFAGDVIPADLRVLHCRDLFVSQAALTGEAMPVEKTAAADLSTAAPTERRNILFMGCHVTSGSAQAVVVATGSRTVFGGIASELEQRSQPTAFDRSVGSFIRLVLVAMSCMVLLVLLVNGLGKGDWMQALLFSLAIAVGLTPEMLPVIITINLAKGAISIANKKVIVKRLAAIQNLGAMDVLCTDKTGTLTQDLVLLERHVDIQGNPSEKVLELAYLNARYQTGLKNLLDNAVLAYADIHKNMNVAAEFNKLDELPFDFERRRMSVLVEDDKGRHLLITKGAVEEIMDCCIDAELDGALVDLQDRHQRELYDVVGQLSREGFRVIAVACKTLPAGHAPLSKKDESGLTMIGYIAFLDPPKDSAAPAIRALRHHGVDVKVLSGDNADVARHVCRLVGLADEAALLGSELESMRDDELAVRVATTKIFAKLAPSQKARVIRVLRSSGHIVGYLGDGINDGPALKAADVGISVDSAVDIAKECADIILLRKSLMVLKDGVLEGRRVFGNISKYLRISASSNLGNMISMLGASTILPFLPMAPVQILVNNLLYDFSQAAIASDHVDNEFLKRPRRWDIADVAHYMLAFGLLSSMFDYLSFAVLWRYSHGAANPALFQTGWFLESLLSQTLVVHIIRTGKTPFVQSIASPALLATTAVVCCVGILLPWSPLAPGLGLTPLPLEVQLAIIAIVAAYLGTAELSKRWLTRRFALR